MRLLIGVMIAFVAAFAGCTEALVGVDSNSESCPSDAIRMAAFLSYEQQESDLLEAFDVPYVMVMEGTIEGEVDTLTIAVNPAMNAARFSANDFDMRIVGPMQTYSSDIPEENWHGRDYDPAMHYATFLSEMFATDDMDVSFADDLELADYSVSCKMLGAREVIEFSYVEGTTEHTFMLENTAPYRLLRGTQIDPALQDNFRVRMSYDAPTIKLETGLPRVAVSLTVATDVLVDNERGGFYYEGTFDAATEWVPLRELEFQLIDGDGTIYMSGRLEEGVFDLDDGDWFEFRDKDNNDKVSPGDEMFMDVGAGLDIVFFDSWANDYAFETYDE